MERRNRSALVAGILLILLGGVLLLFQLVPPLRGWFSWPFILIGVGVLMLLLAPLTRTPDLAVPGCVIGGVGLILLYQNNTGDWASWSFAWALIPGFAGIGNVISGLLSRRPAAVREGLTMVLFSGVLFVIFASFLGGREWLGDYWPLLLVGLGLWLLVQPFLGRKK